MTTNIKFDNYLNLLQKIMSNSDLSLISNLYADINKLFQNDGRIFLAGNGGSSAIANHAEIDLSKIEKSNTRVNAISLVSNMAKITAYANDDGYENIFTNNIEAYKPNKKDLVVTFSSSGNSENIINLLSFCKRENINYYALLGFDGGKVKNQFDNNITFNSTEGYYGPIEDLHMMVIHMVAHMLKEDIREIN